MWEFTRTPPSQATQVPVTKEARSEASQTTGFESMDPLAQPQ